MFSNEHEVAENKETEVPERKGFPKAEVAESNAMLVQ